MAFEELLRQPVNHYVKNFDISRALKDVSNTVQNFMFMGLTGFEIAGGPADHPLGIRCGYQKAW